MTPNAHPCRGCPTSGERRDFLKTIAAALAATAALGLTPREAAAFAVRFGTAVRRAGSELTYPVPAADGATIDHENDVIVVRWQGKAYAFNLSCPHQNTALHWLGDEGRFQCPKHKSKYQPDGTFISGRATRGMDRLAIRRDAAQLEVDLSRLFKEDVDQAGWSAAVAVLA